MNRWLRGLALYAPGIALFIAGVVVLTTTPLYSSPQTCVCTGPPGSVCMCPSISPGTYNPTGPLLLFGAGVCSLLAFAVNLLGRRESQRGTRSPESA
jgi:hypothetical protein